MIEKYKIAYKTNDIFEMDDDFGFNFENSKISLEVSKKIIELLKIEVDAEDEHDAETKANNIISSLNNYWCYLYGSFLVSEPLKIEFMEKPNGRRTVIKMLELRRSIRNKVNSNDIVKLYSECKLKRKMQKLLKLFGDANRSFKWEFLSYYKVIEKFRREEITDSWISNQLNIPQEVDINDRGGKKRTRFTWNRINMAHLQSPQITKEDLNSIKYLAKKYLESFR